MNLLRTSLSRLQGLGISLAALGLSLAGAQEAGPGLWQAAEPPPSHGKPWVNPRVFKAFRLDHAGMRAALSRAPREGGRSIRDSAFVVSLPMPDGAMARFRCVESPIMEPELAAKFPEITTFAGQGLDDPSATVRFDLTPTGLHAQILSPNGAVYIDPGFRGDSRTHVSYHKRDYVNGASDFQCRTASGMSGTLQAQALALPMDASGGGLRIYRLACAATGEYTAYQGGTVAAAMAAIATAVNRVNGVYEADLGIRLVLVANNDQIVYTDPNLDPYSNYDGSSMLKQNQSTIDAIIGPANYDIGHVFSTGGGGMAYFGVVCRDGMKAGGVTGSAAPVGDAFWIDYVAHEMGHQFGASHTFNSATGACGGGNRAPYAAFEPGSGSTIMAYAGICGADNLQPHSDPYFHSVSIEQILNYVASAGVCAGSQPNGNNPPLVSAGLAFVIPMSTPFVLTAVGSDPDGDQLTYCWEERDLGPSAALSDPDNGASPLFRSFAPVAANSRTFPQMASVLGNANGLGEQLPTTSRLMSFRVVARDQHPGGGAVGTADTQVQVVTNAGPFVVTSPNTPVQWAGVQTVTWDVAGTADPPVSAGFVNIRLSTNSGADFPILLAANVPNSGAQAVTLPQISNSTCRIMVESAGNIFFDVSDVDFTIVPAFPQIAVESSVLVAENCSPANKAVDPGETVLMNFTLRNTGSADATNLVVSLVPTGQIKDPSAPQTYGRLPAGGAAVTGTFAFTSGGVCGATLSAVLQLQDGANSYGSITNALPVTASNLPCCTGIAPRANLAVGESIAPGVVQAGSNAVAYLSVTNQGPNTASNVVISAALPSGLAFLGASTSQGTHTYSNGTITFVLGHLDYASSAQMNLTVVAACPGQFTNSVQAASGTPETSGSDNAASAVLVVTPAVGPPVISGIGVSNGVVNLSWQAVPGQSYQVEYTASLESAGWTALGSGVTATGPVATQTDDAAGSVPRRFYRVKVVP